MELLIVRHGIAVERGTPGVADEERRLTEDGERKFRRAALGLACILPAPDVILTSPLPRARQTAELAAEAWGGIALTEAPALAGGSFSDVGALIAGYADRGLVAIVGHEPDLSGLLARILGTPFDDRLAFKKGGAALVDLAEGRIETGGRLLWFLAPKVLRDLGD